MGHGSYDSHSRSVRATSTGLTTRSASEIFNQRSINNAMSPLGVETRESRDSAAHPVSIPIIIALDITGSMGSIPHYLVKEGLPHIMQRIIDAGIAHPQVLFLGVGDHECDRSPLQVGQFESSDELLDTWLTKLWIEGGGGGNEGESYHLAWMFAANYTATDHFQKRHQKGILFTIGDEPTLTKLPAQVQQNLLGDGKQYSAQTATKLLAAAREKYEVFHLHLMHRGHGTDSNVYTGWQRLMQDNVLPVQSKEHVVQVIADKVIEVINNQGVDTSTAAHTRFTDI